MNIDAKRKAAAGTVVAPLAAGKRDAMVRVSRETQGRGELEYDLTAIEIHEHRPRRIEPSPFVGTGGREDLGHGDRRRWWWRRLLPRSDRGRGEREDDRKRCGCPATGPGGGVREGPMLSVHALILGPVERGRDIA